jgi:hypothetical protein
MDDMNSAIHIHLAAARVADVDRAWRRSHVYDVDREPRRRERRALRGARRGRGVAPRARPLGG